MSAEGHSECKKAFGMQNGMLNACPGSVCFGKRQPGRWVDAAFRNGSEHTEWVGAYRMVYAFLDGALNLLDGSLNSLDGSLKTGPSPRPVPCLFSVILRVNAGICRWIVQSQSGARLAHPVPQFLCAYGWVTQFLCAQSRVRTPPQSASLSTHPFSCARGVVEQVRFVCAHGPLPARGRRAGADLGYGRSQECINRPGN